MRSKKRIFLVLLGALCIVIGVASIAWANGSRGSEGEAPLFTWGRRIGEKLVGFMPKAVAGGMGRGSRMFGEGAPAFTSGNTEAPVRVVLAYIAGKTGTPMETLYQEYKDGKTLEEIAEAYGVDWAEIEEAIVRPVPGRFMSEERLEAAIRRVTENIARTGERMEKFESRLPEYEARIAEIEDETLREFAKRHLDLMKECHGLGGNRLAIMQKRLALLQDMLDYAKSR